MHAAVVDSSVNYQHIYRIRFVRGVKSSYLAGSSVSCDLILCSEFSDQQVDKALLQVLLWRTLICRAAAPAAVAADNEVVDNVSESEEEPLHCSVQLLKGNKVRLSFTLPTTLCTGRYHLIFSVQQLHLLSLEQSLVLSLMSDVFNIQHREACDTISSMPLLTNYRCLSFESLTLQVKEEYGCTIGSHIYDSAIIIIKYLQKEQDSFSWDLNGSMLELGAGCGLTGIWFAKRYGCKALLTDQTSQLPILQSNIILNNMETQCDCAVFDWQQSVDSFGATLLNSIQLVIAGDVLYDISAAQLLLNVIFELATKTTNATIILGQKNRNNLSVEASHAVLLSMMPLLTFQCVYTESGVFIWKISHTQI